MSPSARSGDGVIEAELVRVRLPLRRPLRSAHGVETVRDLVLVRVRLDDGVDGWGECSALSRPTYTGEFTDGAWMVLRDELIPALRDGRDDGVVGHPMARSAVAAAVTDARLRQAGRRLVDDLGARHGRPRERVPVTAVVGRSDDVAATVAAVAAHFEEGAAMVKLKVTPHPTDLEAVAAVRATWPDRALAVDGNGSLDARSVSILDTHGLIYLEQPAPADDLVASATLARRIDTPVVLDESATSVAAVRSALALGAGSLVNVKPARFGGPRGAAEAARSLAEDGCGVFVGGMLETAVGRASALAVAALPVFALPTDLGPSSRYFQRDVAPGLELDGGHLSVPGGPGFGTEPDPEIVAEWAVDRLVIGPWS